MQLAHPDIELVAACREPGKLLSTYRGEVRTGDLRDPAYLDRVLAGIDIICHAAGWSSFEKSGDTCNKAYLEPTIDLINHAIEWRVSRFVNLSSLYSAAPLQRNNAEVKGKPRHYWPMMNCLIAVEDYLRNYTESRCQFVNLRLGLYSGNRLNLGLLPWLLSQSGQTALPSILGRLGHMPLVDGRDIGQAFARAALAPLDATFSSFNITGPTTPAQAEVIRFLADQPDTMAPLNRAVPPALASLYAWLHRRPGKSGSHARCTAALLDMLKSPLIDNTRAARLMGYDPEVSWQASLLSCLETHKNQKLSSSISQPYRPLNLE